MLPTAFRLLIDHHRQVAVAGHVRQEIEGRIGGVSVDQFIPEGRGIATAAGRYVFPHPRSLDWIISARRMLSAIFEYTIGDDLISSRFSRTAAMSEAAIRR